MEMIQKVWAYAWPDFNWLNEDDLQRFLLLSLALFVPAFVYYALAAWLVYTGDDPWVALVYAPELVGLLFFSVFVSWLGSRLAGALLEMVALFWLKIAVWGVFLGGTPLWRFGLLALFVWYATQLARACFALADQRAYARW